MADSGKNESFLSKIRMKTEKLGENLFSPKDKSGEEKLGDAGKKKLSRSVVYICAAAIIVLFALKMFGGGETAENAKPAPSEYDTDYSEYVRQMESSLEEIIGKIQGAGNVSVRIYIDSTAENVLAEDSKKESETREKYSGSDGANEKNESVSDERNTVIAKDGGLSGEGAPYVVRRKLPYPTGIIVVADGARDNRVQSEIYEAVRALYGLSANRIKICY